MNEDLKTLYQDLILDHSRHPHHFGRLAEKTQHARGYNPLCGDQIELDLKLDAGRIAAIAFEGKGCALCLASASMMTDAVSGKTPDEAEALGEKLHHFCMEEGVQLPNEESVAPLHALGGVRQYPARVKCATLPWHALKAALAGENNEVTTE